VLHISEAKVINLSRGDVFTLLSDDFDDVFRAQNAPCSKIMYLSLCMRCVSCGILKLVLLCLKIPYFSYDSDD